MKQEQLLKYRVYLKDKTTIDCLDIREEKDKYIFSLPNGGRPLSFELSFDEVDMISYNTKVFGCELDSMALGLEPHKQEAMLRYIKKRFEEHNNEIRS